MNRYLEQEGEIQNVEVARPHVQSVWALGAECSFRIFQFCDFLPWCCHTEDYIAT